ncbi:MAG: hypothetical protein HXS50_03365, partial [Theionarchaea archaeon]|nr:hypothetical protein [Theionarchaea archaeon]
MNHRFFTPLLVLFLLLAPQAVIAQGISFEVEREHVDVWILKDGSVDIHYTI